MMGEAGSGLASRWSQTVALITVTGIISETSGNGTAGLIELHRSMTHKSRKGVADCVKRALAKLDI